MSRPAGLLYAAAIALPVSLAAIQTTRTATDQTPAQQPVPPVFRAVTALVPVDVRVLDQDGRPVTDLGAQDFTLVEDNQPQSIRHFSTQALVAAKTPVKPAPLLRVVRPASAAPASPAAGDAPTPAPAELARPSHRTFLIVLGRGRLQPVTQAIDGMVRLVKDLLLPQDYVAVIAYNRATDFTTDHSTVARVLEEYTKQHEKIEAAMALQFSGLGAAYGGTEIPPAIQADIDRIFAGAGAAARTMTGEAADARRMAADQRQTADALLRRDIAARSGGAGTTDVVDATLGINLTFDEYVEVTAQSMQDLSKIYAGISYLRDVEGEKHLIFVSERGLFLPRAEDDRGIAAAAADARVVIDILHTGGTPEPPMPGARAAGAGGRGGGAVAGGGGAGAGRAAGAAGGRARGVGAGGGRAGGDQGARAGGRGARAGGARGGGGRGADWRISTSQIVAAQTGGEFSSTRTGRDFVARLDRATRFSYLLGYYPSNTNPDGRYRRIEVRVNRPGVTVHFRHGYFAEQQAGPIDRARMRTYSRVAMAANTAQAITDIALTATAENVTLPDGSAAVEVVVRIRPERLGLTDVGGRKTGAIDVAIFCADERETLLGESWNTVDLDMTPEAFASFQTNGVSYAGRVPVTAPARFVKVVVYDPASDTIGSAVIRLEPGALAGVTGR